MRDDFEVEKQFILYPLFFQCVFNPQLLPCFSASSYHSLKLQLLGSRTPASESVGAWRLRQMLLAVGKTVGMDLANIEVL